MSVAYKRALKEGRSRYLEGNVCIDVFLHLNLEELIIQKKEYPKRFSSALTQPTNKVRRVVMCRKSGGGLGLSIKGGAEHGLPILVSRVLNKDFGDYEDSLHVGDAIIEVNGENVQSMSHEEVVSMLKCAGDRVELKVKFYQPAFQYLTLQRDSLPRPSLKRGDDVYDTIAGTAVDAFEKRWTTFKTLTLKGSQVTRAKDSDENVMHNTLLLTDRCAEAKLQFDDFETFSGWMRDLQKTIIMATKSHIFHMNIGFEDDNQITYMAWVDEENDEEMIRSRNVSIKGDSLFIFDRTPMNLIDWSTCEESYKIYECLLIKTGERRITLRHFVNPTKNLEFRSQNELIDFLISWYSCNFFTVSRLKTKKLEAFYEGNSGHLNLNIESSTLSFLTSDTKMLWTVKFSQIKEYDIYVNSKMLLQIWNETRTESAQKMITCSNVFENLCYLHSFITARLVSLDPMFFLLYELY